MVKKMRQFDCQDMPDEVKNAYFEVTSGESNDVWLEFHVCIQPRGCPSNCVDEYIKVSKWLKKKKCRENSTVLIKHWW